MKAYTLSSEKCVQANQIRDICALPKPLGVEWGRRTESVNEHYCIAFYIASFVVFVYCMFVVVLNHLEWPWMPSGWYRNQINQ